MTQPAQAPASSRAIASSVSELASPQAMTRIEEARHMVMTVRYLPNRSPIGPMKSCTEPWATA